MVGTTPDGAYQYGVLLELSYVSWLIVECFWGKGSDCDYTDAKKKKSFFSSDTLEVKNFFEAHNTL